MSYEFSVAVVSEASGDATVSCLLPDGRVAESEVNVSGNVYTISGESEIPGLIRVLLHVGSELIEESLVVGMGDPFVNVDEIRTYLQVERANDDELEFFIRTAMFACENYTSRQFAVRQIVESHQNLNADSLILRNPAALKVLGVWINGVEVNDFVLSPGGESISFTSGVSGEVKVMYWCGVVDAKYQTAKHAVKQMTKHLWATQRGSRNLDGEWDPQAGYTFPSRVQQLLEPLMVAGIA